MGVRSGSENEKALRYIVQLDDARCTGRWKDVPELCRKIEKHAPHRQCLTLTARSEAQIAAYSIQRPSTAASAASTASAGLSNIIPTLLTAIDKEGDHVQDAFQATVSLAWLHYVLDEPGLAIARLPKDLAVVASSLSTREAALGGWTRVCLVKGAFLRGSSLEKTDSLHEAVPTYASVLPWLSSSQPPTAETPQFRMWTEHLLVRLCQLSDQSTGTGHYLDPSEALQAYRFWAKYWESGVNGAATEGPNAARYRRLAWKAYYDTISAILRRKLAYSAESVVPENHQLENNLAEKHASSRLQQRAELKRVEAVYESLLLKETHFPKASESNDEIEAWADAVMDNWRFLCGPTWSNEDLGEGGKEGVGRGVLDILYRAATKTFHSTQILRHLFTVHTALAEFDLGFKAYDSYVNIITRGKDRAEKTGEEEAGLDDDSTILRTSAEAIRVLCRFGSRKEAAKAVEVGHHIEKWIEQTEHIRSTTSEAGSIRSVETMLEPRSLATAYCAMGISQAHWARFTYEADARSAILTKAIQYLRKSLEPKFDDTNNLQALYALALVLAEKRDIPGALKIVKKALSPATRDESSMSPDGALSDGPRTEFGRERKLISLWHLLALLLTSRSEFTASEKACEAAFEQFGDSTVLFGRETEDAYRSEHLNVANGHDVRNFGLVDQMEGFEKSGILQVKMTQLSLVEVVDGSSAAVDGCDELLALYARLFGDPATERTKMQPPSTAMAPPKSAIGTVRGSIFRSRGSVKKSNQDAAIIRSSSIARRSRASTVATQATAAPTIQVTDEDSNGRANSHHHHLFHHKHNGEQSSLIRSASKLRKRSASSLRRRSEIDAEKPSEVPDFPDSVNSSTSPPRDNHVHGKSPRRPSTSSSFRKSIESQDRPLGTVAHNMSSTNQPPPGHSRQPLKQDVRLPTPLPGTGHVPIDPHFTELQERRQKVTLLVKIWIFASGLYTRANMYEDAREAVSEALKLVTSFETDVAQESSTSKALADRGWGGGKSVEELWADAFAARGALLVAHAEKHEARADFERALLHFPDHPEAIVGLSNILLDIYCKDIPLEPLRESETLSLLSPAFTPNMMDTPETTEQQALAAHTPSAENQISPPELNRLAARDRAYGLLSTLTKLGAGWDYSEAWYALARAYEESGQIEKTKEVLWWCVELEDTHPVRAWDNVTMGGFVL
ncbi:filamentation protein-like protein [Massariosphaeria phaeospora]|uniref:Filamentation protein-like protein n=1 Tax=Massariosphaeria phaeospora TaxID=100035 RepID=A0A7C8HZQ2_9PLEO|nr:filamentation protein-like protein [Massariosphaeria phaeospora]